MAFTFTFLILCFFCGQIRILKDSELKSLYYTQTDEIFPNPERGFYRFAPATPISPPLNPDTLLTYRAQNQSLIFRPYLIRDFRESDIPEEFLDKMRDDFQTLREAGLKTLFKFRYSTAIGQPDASLERIFSHLDQLEPLFREYYDVIAVAQGGFIGAWGEWHSSANDLTTPENIRAFLFRFLDILPENRHIQIRSPRHKMNIYETNYPFPAEKAFDGSNISRTGFHNDCFLASPTDVGTYHLSTYPIFDLSEDLSAGWIKENYLRPETRYVPMGGETCNPRPDAGNRYHCETALLELAQMNWSFLNYNYSRRILDTWIDQGCMPEVERRLGYRFTMMKGSFSILSKPGGTFRFNLELMNEGFAAPYNPRGVQVVLRSNDNPQQIWKVDLPDDPRYWLGGEKIQLNYELGLPSDLPDGKYEILLNLPDPAETLHHRPEFSIRLANANTWDKSTGFNHVNHLLNVDQSARGRDNHGDLTFSPAGF